MMQKNNLIGKLRMPIKLGRPQGAKSKKLKMEQNQKYLKILIEQGVPNTQIAKILKVDRSTIYNFIKRKNMHFG